MARQVFSAVLADMIERVKSLTPDQADALGTAWTSQEGISYQRWFPLGAGVDFKESPLLQNPALHNGWRSMMSTASSEGRADELHAAIVAAKAAQRSVRQFKITPFVKAGVVEAARSAVLAVGIRDVIEPATYELLIGPWRQVFGDV